MWTVSEIRLAAVVGLIVAALSALAIFAEHERVAGRAALEKALAAAAATSAAERATAIAGLTRHYEEQLHAYELERDQARAAAAAAAAEPAAVIRVYLPAPGRSAVSSAATGGSGAPGATTASGCLPGLPGGAQPGPDIGPGLRDLAESADITLALARALQARAATTLQVKDPGRPD